MQQSKKQNENYIAQLKEIILRRQEMLPISIGKKDCSKSFLRICDDDKNFLSKSFELQYLIPQNHNLLRRKSGVEQLSSKQIRFNCEYPKTSIAQQEQLIAILQAEQQTKQRRKTIIQRMSGLLKKHQTVIKCFNKNEKPSQKEIHQSQIGQMNTEGTIVTETDKNLQSKQLLENSQFKQNQQEYQVKKLIKSYKRQKNIDKTKPKVILSLSQQTQKPFQTITNYVNEKTTSLRDLSFGKIPMTTNKKHNFIPNKSFVEFQDLVSSPKYSQKKSNLIQSCLNLPDIKFNYSSRVHNQNPYLIRRGNKSYQHPFLHSQKAL